MTTGSAKANCLILLSCVGFKLISLELLHQIERLHGYVGFEQAIEKGHRPLFYVLL